MRWFWFVGLFVLAGEVQALTFHYAGPWWSLAWCLAAGAFIGLSGAIRDISMLATLVFGTLAQLVGYFAVLAILTAVGR